MSPRSIASMRARKLKTAAGTRENVIETALLDACRNHGLLPLKFTSPSRGGVPDRLIITPVGSIFVELKRPGLKPDGRQLNMHQKLRDYGGEVHVIDTIEKVDDFIADITARAAKQQR